VYFEKNSSYDGGHAPMSLPGYATADHHIATLVLSDSEGITKIGHYMMQLREKTWWLSFSD